MYMKQEQGRVTGKRYKSVVRLCKKLHLLYQVTNRENKGIKLDSSVNIEYIILHLIKFTTIAIDPPSTSII